MNIERLNNKNMVGTDWMEVLRALTEGLKLIYKENLKEVILYGSVARGTAEEDSDIDIMVLVDVRQDELKNYEERLCDVSTDFALKYFRMFSIVDICYEEYKEWKDTLPFYKNVEKEGVKLYAA